MEEIEPHLAEFLRASICSLWTLELLLLLHHRPERRWSVEQANRELRATPALVASRLKRLEKIGLVRFDGSNGWRFCPRTEALAAMVDLLADTVCERPFAVVNALLARQDKVVSR
jgi:hypothetical protein